MSSASTSASSTTQTSPSFLNSSVSNSAVKSRSSAVDDLRNAKFTSAFRGYDPAEVRAFLQRMATRVEVELGLADRVVLTPIAPDVELVLDEAAYLAATEAAASALDSAAVQSADEVLLAARSEYEAILASARNEANAIVVKANDDAARIILRARAESRGKPSADSSAVVEAAYAQAASDPELAREQARLMITEARAVRERILTDLNKRRRVAHVQLEQLRVAREKLTETLREARRIVDDSARDLSTAEVEARLAADAAGRRISAEALPSIGELEVELWGGRHMPSTPTFGSSRTPVSDADDSFENSRSASPSTPSVVAGGEAPGAANVEAPVSAIADAPVVGIAVSEVTAVPDVVVAADEAGSEVLVGDVAAVEVEAVDVVGPDVAGVAADVAVAEVAEVASDVTEAAVQTGLVLSVPMLEDAAIEGAAIESTVVDRATVEDVRGEDVRGEDAEVEDAVVVGTEPETQPTIVLVVDSHDAAATALSDTVLDVREGSADAAVALADTGSGEQSQADGVEVAKKRPANVDDLFARLRADRERAALEARSVLGAQQSKEAESTGGAVLDLRPNDGGDAGGPGRGRNGSGSKRSKGSSGSVDSSGSSKPTSGGTVVVSAQPAAARAGSVATLDRSDTDDQVTAIVLDLRPTSSAPEPRMVSVGASVSDSEDTVSEADDGMDFVVGPLHSSLIRTVKRRLHDEQSSILAMLRNYRGTLDVDRLLGSAQDHQLRLTAEIHPIFVDAFRVGAEKSGARMTDAEIDDLLREHIESVAASVTASIRSEVASIVAEQGGNDSRALGESLTSTYRTWTTERIGTVVTGAVVETYRLGTAA